MIKFNRDKVKIKLETNEITNISRDKVEQLFRQ